MHRELLSDCPQFGVPRVIDDLTTKRVLTTELITGVPLDHCVSLPQDVKNGVSNQSPLCIVLSSMYNAYVPSRVVLLMGEVSSVSVLFPFNSTYILTTSLSVKTLLYAVYLLKYFDHILLLYTVHMYTHVVG